MHPITSHSLKKVTEIILYDSTIRIFPKLESVEKVCNSKFKIKKFVSISNFKVECPLYQKRLRKLISKIILTTFSNNSFSVSLSSLLSNLHHNMFQFCFRLHVFTLFSHCGSKHYKIGTPHMLFKGSKICTFAILFVMLTLVPSIFIHENYFLHCNLQIELLLAELYLP